MNISDIESVETPYGTFFGFREDLITKQLNKYGAHQRNDLAMLKTFVSSGDTIIDVGAHIGTFSIPLASIVGKSGRIYAFEGDENTFELLIENIKRNNCQDVIIPVCAIVTGSRGNFQPIRRPCNSGATKFLCDPTACKPAQYTLTLDGYFDDSKDGFLLERLDVIKIDVEGMEEDVLLSCRNIIGRYKPVLLVEIGKKALQNCGGSISNIQTYLDAYGYNYFRNLGKKHSTQDRFIIGQLPNVKYGGNFYDLLAVHSSSQRYPLSYRKGNTVVVWRLMEHFKVILRMFTFLEQNIGKRLDGLTRSPR